MEIPKHIAIIMDGNGRWAERRGRPRVHGHIRGCARVRDIIREADRLGVRALTLYAFSSENWGRPDTEVGVLMRLLSKWLMRERRELMDKKIRFRAIGDLSKLPAFVRKLVDETTELSLGNTGLNLTLALSYSGRGEILEATKRACVEVAAGKLRIQDISEGLFGSYLQTADLGDPDLLIRTSGEERISNFLLWQLAYAELYFAEVMWPDFKPVDFRRAIDSFARRQRRFGLTQSQVESTDVNQTAHVGLHAAKTKRVSVSDSFLSRLRGTVN